MGVLSPGHYTLTDSNAHHQLLGGVIVMFKQEKEQLHEYALRKLARNELDVIELNRILNRIYNIGYFQGRKEGEKFKEMSTQQFLKIKKVVTS